MATVDDPDIVMDEDEDSDEDSDEEMEEEQDEEIEEEQDEEIEEEQDGSVGPQPVVMEVKDSRASFSVREIPVDSSYGKPRLDGLPTRVLLKIVYWIGLGDTVALRRTCKALNRFVSETPGVWDTRVRQQRRTTLLMGADPLSLPRLRQPAFQEELLRCALILHHNWHKQAFQLQPISGLGPSWSTQGVEQASLLAPPPGFGRV
ncbi:hypothetical protein FRC10_000958 [Ceratobasidium sp. 414]|nr:hypothetical protein FRC10_000958 [Ceratobasidium sp. 414]